MILLRTRRASLRLALFALLALAAPLRAQQLPADCSVTSTPVAFGVYDPMLAAPLDGAGEIVVDCRRSNTETVYISLGTGSSGSYALRRMTGAGGGLGYNLYLDANATRVFGDGTGGSQGAWCVTGVDGNGCAGSNPSGQGRRARLPFFGRIPPQQDVAAGLYTDTVMVRIDF